MPKENILGRQTMTDFDPHDSSVENLKKIADIAKAAIDKTFETKDTYVVLVNQSDGVELVGTADSETLDYFTETIYKEILSRMMEGE